MVFLDMSTFKQNILPSGQSRGLGGANLLVNIKRPIRKALYICMKVCAKRYLIVFITVFKVQILHFTVVPTYTSKCQSIIHLCFVNIFHVFITDTSGLTDPTTVRHLSINGSMVLTCLACSSLTAW